MPQQLGVNPFLQVGIGCTLLNKGAECGRALIQEIGVTRLQYLANLMCYRDED